MMEEKRYTFEELTEIVEIAREMPMGQHTDP